MHRIRFFNQVEVETNKDEITKLLKNALVNHSEFCVRYTVAKLRVRANIVLENYLSLKNGDYFKKLKSYQSRLLDKKEIDLIVCLERCISLILDYSTVVQASNEILNDLLKQYDKFNLQFENLKKSLHCEICSELKIIKCEIEQCIHEKPTMDALIYISSGNITNIELPIDHSKKIKTISKKGEELKYFEDGEFKALENFINKQTNYNYETVNLTIGFFNIGLAENIPFPEPKQLAPLSPEQKLIQNLKHTYTTDIDFTQIRTIGITSENFPTLSMDDYYMDLSFLDREELEDRNIYIRKEMEEFRNKVTKNKFSNNYISESILLNYGRVVIIGNPGCGKSTFARWLCYNWAKKSKKDQLIPIFINLRNLRWDNFDLVKYITKAYKLKSKEVNSILTSSNLKFRLILDGLDEIDNENKNRLYHYIHTLNTELEESYILLCRPYALSQNDFKQFPSIEIIGYNDSSRNYYIERIFSYHPDQLKQQKKLNELLDINPVLCDFSYNPLMLSMIVESFFSKNGNKGLDKIETTYDMHYWTQNRIINYAIDRGDIKIEDWHKNENNIHEFAYEMMMNKTFVYSGETLDKYRFATQFLAQCGLGKFESYGKSNWQFYFHTIVTQEYLAANFVSTTITSKALLKLCKYDFFTNLSLFIIGHINSNNQNKCILYLEDIYTLNSPYYNHIFFKLLAETSSTIINKIFRKNIINSIIDSLIDNSKFKFGYSTFQEFKQIINKLYPECKKQLIDSYIHAILIGINESNLKTKKINSLNPYVLAELSIELNLHKEKEFLSNYLDLLEYYIQYTSDVDKITKVKTILKERSLWDPLRHISKLTTPDFIEIKEKIESIYSKSPDEKFSNYIDIILGYCIESKTSVKFLLELKSIMKGIGELDHSDPKRCDLIQTITQKIIHHTWQVMHAPKCYNHHFYILLKELIPLIGKPKFLSEEEDCQFDLFRQYTKIKSSDSLDFDIDMILNYDLLSFVYYEKKQIQILLDECAKHSSSHPLLFYKTFIYAGRFFVPYNHIDLFIDTLLKLDSLPNFIDKDIADIVENDQTNSIFISKLYNSRLTNNDLFLNNVLIQAIKRNGVYDKQIWKQIKVYALNENLHRDILKILSNQEIYLYNSNIKQIKEVWNILLNNFIVKDLEPDKTAKIGLLIIGSTVLLEEILFQGLEDEFYPVLNTLKKFYYTTHKCTGLQTITNSLVLDFLLKENNYTKSFFKESIKIGNIENAILELFTTNEIQHLEPWLGKNLKEKVYIMAQKEEEEEIALSFNREEFESLLV